MVKQIIWEDSLEELKEDVLSIVVFMVISNVRFPMQLVPQMFLLAGLQDTHQLALNIAKPYLRPFN